LAHEPGTRLGEDPEPLHQMRVSTRRMRAALKLFGTVLPVASTRVSEELGWLAGVLGAVRDLDIQLERLEGWTEHLEGRHRQALDELGDLLVSHHTNARETLLEALESRRYERLVASLTSMLDRGGSRRGPASQAGALEVLPELIAARHRDVVKAARRAHRTGIVDDFHRLRIRCKRLRYAIEFTGDLYAADVKRYAKHIAALQDDLGLIQDAETAANRLQTIALGAEGDLLPRATVFAMGMVAERCSAEAASRLGKLPATKQMLNAPGWNKAREVMERRREQAIELTAGAGDAVSSDQAGRPPTAPGSARPALGTRPMQLATRPARRTQPAATTRTRPAATTRTRPAAATRTRPAAATRTEDGGAGAQPAGAAEKTVTVMRRRLAPS